MDGTNTQYIVVCERPQFPVEYMKGAHHVWHLTQYIGDARYFTRIADAAESIRQWAQSKKSKDCVFYIQRWKLDKRFPVRVTPPQKAEVTVGSYEQP